MIDLSNKKPEKPEKQGWEAEEIAVAVVAVILWSVIAAGWLGIFQELIWLCQ